MTSVVVAAALGLASATWTQPYDLRLRVTVDQEKQSVIYAELVDVQLAGMSMGVTGSAQADLALRVTGVSEDGNTVDARISLSQIRAVFNGAEQGPPQVAPLGFTVDQRGRVLKLDLADTQSAVDIMAASGTALQVLGCSMVVARFPDEPVEVGDEWEFEDAQPTPFGVEATVRLKGKLAAVEDGKARLEYTITGTIPPFQAPNPVQPGMAMTVRDGVTQLEDFSQVVDLETGLVDETSGRLSVAFQVAMEGWNQPMPAALQLEFAGGRDQERAKAILDRPGTAAPEAAPGAQGRARPGDAGQQESFLREPASRAAGAGAADAGALWAEWWRRCARLSPAVRVAALRVGLQAALMAASVDRAARETGDRLIAALPRIAQDGEGFARWLGQGIEDGLAQLLLATGCGGQ